MPIIFFALVPTIYLYHKIKHITEYCVINTEVCGNHTNPRSLELNHTCCYIFLCTQYPYITCNFIVLYSTLSN